MQNKLLKYTICILAILSSTFLHGQKYGYQWTKQVGSGSIDIGNFMTTDDSGNSYITGRFLYTVDFDPGPGVFNLNAIVNRDIFILKLDKNGNFRWAKKMGWTQHDEGLSIHIDGSGNVLTTGYFNNTVDFDPGLGTFNLTATGVSSDIFVQKLDSNGNFLWAKRVGSGSSDNGNSIVTDSQENIYITGFFEGTVDFDPGQDTFNLTSMGRADSYVLKLDDSGNFLWVKQIGGIYRDEGHQIILDDSENLYSIGNFNDTVDFDPNTGTFNLTSAGNSDVYIQKLDTAGNFIWAKGFGGTSYENGYSITTDAKGNTFSTGSFALTVDLDPGPSTTNFTSAGGSDVFIQKLDSNGNYIWAKQVGGVFGDYAQSINVDAQGNILTSGYFGATADFDPGTGVYNLSSIKFDDGFILMLDSNANFAWVKQIGGNSHNRVYSSVIDQSGNLYSTGYFGDSVDFNHSGGVDNLVASGYSDIFIQKLSPCTTITSIDSVIACDSFTWINGITYTSSNQTAVYTLESSRGCDSTVSLHLTMNYSSSSIDTIVSCDSITWIDGITYTNSNNTASFTLSNSVGCDSIVNLDLTINSNSSIDKVSACDSIRWIDGNTYYASTNNTVSHTLTNSKGCDSIITLDLTINSNFSTDSITSCGSIRWIDGNTYSSSNDSAVYTLTNALGCDSVVSLYLTVDSVSDVSTNINSFWISTNNISASAYQWLDCNNNYSIIPNETDTAFFFSQNGSYAVEITEGQCVDTSDCVIISTVGINNIKKNDSFSVSPNPTKNKIIIEFKHPQNNVEIEFRSIKGKLLAREQHFSLLQTDFELNQSAGLYFLVIKTATGQRVVKVIKK